MLRLCTESMDASYLAYHAYVSETPTHSFAKPALAATPATIAQTLIGENGQNCVVQKFYSCMAASDLRCARGWTLVGWDKDGCNVIRPGTPTCENNCYNSNTVLGRRGKTHLLSRDHSTKEVRMCVFS